MSDQVPISTDHPTVVILRTVFGSTYGTVQVHLGTAIREAPVRLGAEHAVGDYGLVMAQATPSLLPVGKPVRALLGGCGEGTFHELPDLEIFIGATDQTVGEYFVAQGWAIPSAELFDHHLRHDRYLDALRTARAHHAGIWGETGITAAAIGLSPDLDAASAPKQGTPAWAVEAALVVLLVLAMAIGLRDRQSREAATPAAAPGRPEHASPARNGGGTRRLPRLRDFPGGGLVGSAMSFYFGGLLPPRPRPLAVRIPTAAAQRAPLAEPSRGSSASPPDSPSPPSETPA